jgi:hypothetical protein
MKFVLAVALLLTAACAHRSHAVKGSACAEDLVNGGYVSDIPSAEAYCREYSKDQLACAKQSYDNNPGSEFAITIGCMR